MVAWLTEVGKSGEKCGNIFLLLPARYQRCALESYFTLMFSSQERSDFFSTDMFIGEYQHTIDPKKRLALPSKFRTELGKKVVVTRGLDNCLFVYPIKVWEELATKLGTLPVGEAGTRSFIRVMLAGATDVEVDSQGRILVPEYLKKDGGLKKEVTVVGLFNRLEIWDSSKWSRYKLSAEKNTGKIAEELGKLGIY